MLWNRARVDAEIDIELLRALDSTLESAQSGSMPEGIPKVETGLDTGLTLSHGKSSRAGLHYLGCAAFQRMSSSPHKPDSGRGDLSFASQVK